MENKILKCKVIHNIYHIFATDGVCGTALTIVSTVSYKGIHIYIILILYIDINK